jgi:hypothetical protein
VEKQSAAGFGPAGNADYRSDVIDVALPEISRDFAAERVQLASKG